MAHDGNPTIRRAAAGDASPPPRTNPRRALGIAGEEAAAAFLQRRGYRIVARNVRSPLGELDIVAIDGEVVVFVEVKTRRNGGALEAVDPRKQRRLTRLARAFLVGAGWSRCRARFDVVAVDGHGMACTHVVNAFDCPSDY
ncbi:MAG TPA: YraN family protein [Candidatus Limnocylindrales bacterium]|nr:YraN family protein [Candidatus Limnocylindrales bacterium]